MAVIDRLSWDSEFFGYEIGKYVINNREYFDFEKFKNQSLSFKLVYVISKEEVYHENLNLFDKKVIFLKKNIFSEEIKASKIEIYSFDKEKHDLEQLITLAIESGVYSRFNLDPNFANKDYVRLYTEWILNSINGKLAFDLLIALRNSEILGFTTITNKTNLLADIGLVSVSKKARGKGVATNLINKTIDIAKQNNFKNIQVVTQLKNVPATKLYTKSGFAIQEITNIYHYWNL